MHQEVLHLSDRSTRTCLGGSLSADYVCMCVLVRIGHVECKCAGAGANPSKKGVT